MPRGRPAKNTADGVAAEQVVGQSEEVKERVVEENRDSRMQSLKQVEKPTNVRYSAFQEHRNGAECVKVVRHTDILRKKDNKLMRTENVLAARIVNKDKKWVVKVGRMTPEVRKALQNANIKVNISL